MEAALPLTGPELTFAVREGAVLEHTAVPTLRFALEIDAGDAEVRSVALSVELRIAAARRRYDEAEERRLTDLFGPTEQWDRSLHALHWTSLSANVAAFSGRTEVDLPVTCTYDLEVAGAKYMAAIGNGEIPLEFLFSGTVFYAGPGGRLQVARIAWDREAEYRLPVAVWRDAIDRHFPDSAWLRLPRSTFDRLWAYRSKHAHLSWEAALEALLAEDR